MWTKNSAAESFKNNTMTSSKFFKLLYALKAFTVIEKNNYKMDKMPFSEKILEIAVDK